METQTNIRLKLATDFVCYTGKNLFLTGRAGTGKTTFLRSLKNITQKRMVVVAPTGVAAINAGGVTIHSFFQLPFGPQIPAVQEKKATHMLQPGSTKAARYQHFQRDKINIIKSLDLLVIDEISMVRADLLDAIDTVLRRYRNREQPFGGVQLLMIGDLQQLSPIAKDDEWNLLKEYYETVYFFSSKALQKSDYVRIELMEVYRQQDQDFINLLGKIRNNTLDATAFKELNNRYMPNFSPKADEGYITLTTHNYQSQQINLARLNLLKSGVNSFTATIKGEFPEYSYPTDLELKLKEGAQVMFIKNDPSPAKEFYNGKIGKVIKIEGEMVYVLCPGENIPILVTPLFWHNSRYSLDEHTKEITETIIGSFTQYPLKLAWAVTIHKSQGLTFDKVIIDASQAFAFGQVYVALSRCRTLEGLVLSSPIPPSAIKTDRTVNQYIEEIEKNTPNETLLDEARHAYQKSLLLELFDFSLMHKRLGYLGKLLRENYASFDDKVSEAFGATDQKLKTDVSGIAEKFLPEINHLISQNPECEKNEALQIRVKKACDYFSQKLNEIVLTSVIDVESDNKADKKQVDELLDRFYQEAFTKHACLMRCRDGFSVAGYLETRAKASIQPYKQKKVPSSGLVGGMSVKHPELRNLLKSWRDRLANELGIPVYMIVPKGAMSEIADKLPATRASLLAVTGMGKKKVDKFGTQILNLIDEYVKERGINHPVDNSPVDEKPIEKKPPSRQVSFEMFEAGDSIEQIATQRGFAASTIRGHLAHYVGTGQINLEKIMEHDKILLLKDYFSQVDDLSAVAAKDVLGDEVSWSDIHFVIKHLEFEQNKELPV